MACATPFALYRGVHGWFIRREADGWLAGFVTRFDAEDVLGRLLQAVPNSDPAGSGLEFEPPAVADSPCPF